MLNKTDGSRRRLGAYHTGVETKTVAARMPAEKIEAARAVFEKAGMSMSEGIEFLFDTQLLRRR